MAGQDAKTLLHYHSLSLLSLWRPRCIGQLYVQAIYECHAMQGKTCPGPSGRKLTMVESASCTPASRAGIGVAEDLLPGGCCTVPRISLKSVST